MALTPGARLGPYEILAPLGAGGMGEVYRARDPRLDRDVALKVLPEEFLEGEENRSRFRREARALASLSHPNVAVVHSFEEVPGSSPSSSRHILVMELLEGETLRDRLGKGPLPPHNAVELGIGIASGLAAAHAKGIVHRDLKPANVFVTTDGVVKLLDFGLAKVPEPETPVTSEGTTLRREPLTERGAVVGTMGYTSPEQLRGMRPEARSDIFAFGCVLYEMLAGRSPFLKPTGAETVTAIMGEDPPPLSGTGRAIAPALSEIVKRCLEKRPDDRFSTAHDLALALRAISGSAEMPPAPAARASGRRRRRAVGLVLAVASVALAAAAGLLLRARHAGPPLGLMGPGRLKVVFSTADPVNAIALSPDGKMLAYAMEKDGQTDLYVTQVAGGSGLRLTNDAAREAEPRFSPDGDRIVFTRFSPDGEAPEICVMPSLGGVVTPVLAGALRAVWSPDGGRLACILWQTPQPQSLATVGLDGRDLKVLAQADSVYPFFRGLTWSPDGSRLVVGRSTGGQASELWAVGIPDGTMHRLTADPPGVYSADPAFVADGSGIVHVSNRSGAANLWFMPVRGQGPVQLTSGPGPDSSPSVGRSGAIAFMNTHERNGLWVYDLKAGTRQQRAAHSAVLWAPAFSPDGLDIAYSRAEEDGSWHLWIVPTHGGEPRRLTSSPLPEIYPRFSPDGKWVIYCTWSAQADRIWRVPRRGGPPEPLTPERTEDDQYADVSPDGRRLAFTRTEGGETHVVVQEIGSTAARRLTKRASTLPRWSPDGRWIAFTPDRSNSSGIFLVSSEGTDEHRVTESGGWPVWWPDGKALAYAVLGFDNQQRVRIASVTGSPVPSPPVFPVTAQNTPFDVSKDGRTFVITDSEAFSSAVWLLERREGSR